MRPSQKEQDMRFSFTALLFALGLLLTLSGSVGAQAVLISPQGSGPNQKPGVNPFQYLPLTGAGYPGYGYGGPGYGYPGYGYGAPGYGLGPTFMDPYTFQLQQQGLGQAPVAPPSSGLPPFSTQPPARYFGNYQPFYPLIPPGGHIPVASPLAGPPVSAAPL
jgi:hypothetical protein